MPSCCRTHGVIVRKCRNFHESKCMKCGVEWYTLYDEEKMEYLGLAPTKSEYEIDKTYIPQKHFVKKRIDKTLGDLGDYDGIPD